jgi:hypothetical protein
VPTIEVNLSANANKLYSMGFRRPVKRSTPTEANESRDGRIGPDLAVLLIVRARKLCEPAAGGGGQHRLRAGLQHH